MLKKIFKSNIGSLINFLESSKFIYILIIIAVLLRILLLFIFSKYPLVSDASFYHKMALQLIDNETFYPFWPPGLPYYLSFFYKIFGRSEVVGRISMLFLYILFIWIIYIFTVKIATKKIANIVIFILVIYPSYILFSIDVLTELLTSTLIISMLYFMILLFKKKSIFLSILVGLSIGFLTLTRPSTLIFIPFIPLLILFKKKNIVYAIIPLIISILVISVWLGKCYNMTGRIVPINYSNSYNVFIGNNKFTPLYKIWPPQTKSFEYDILISELGEKPVYDRDSMYREIAIKHIVARPDLFLIRTFNRFKVYFSFDSFTGSWLIRNYEINMILSFIIMLLGFIIYMAIMLFFILSVFYSRDYLPKIQNEKISLIFITIFLYSFPYWLSVGYNRFNVPILPLILIVSVIFISRSIDNKNLRYIFYYTEKILKRKNIVFIVLMFFLYIQIEFFIFMISRI